MTRFARLASLLFLVAATGAPRAQDGWKLEIPAYAPEEGRFPVEGEELRFSVPPALDGAKLFLVKITYRPNSKVADEERLEPGADGGVVWRPKAAGLVEIGACYADPLGREDPEAKPAKVRTIAVRFASEITLGVVIMLVAAILLFGGAYVSIRALLARS